MTVARDKILTQLYRDYQALVRKYDDDLRMLATARQSNKTQQLSLQRVKVRVALLEANVVLGETNPKGKVNGKNTETRNRQTTLLLAEYRAQDPTAKAGFEERETLIRQLNNSYLSIKNIEAVLLRHRTVGDMISGLAGSLRGRL